MPLFDAATSYHLSPCRYCHHIFHAFEDDFHMPSSLPCHFRDVYAPQWHAADTPPPLIRLLPIFRLPPRHEALLPLRESRYFALFSRCFLRRYACRLRRHVFASFSALSPLRAAAFAASATMPLFFAADMLCCHFRFRCFFSFRRRCALRRPPRREALFRDAEMPMIMLITVVTTNCR